jgi:hypothetical protein
MFSAAKDKDGRPWCPACETAESVSIFQGIYLTLGRKQP